MKKVLVFVFSFLIVASALKAQTLYTCKAHTENGQPIEYQRNWNINPKGEYIYALLDNENKPLATETLYFMMDKIVEDGVIPYDSKVIKADSTATWIAYNQELSEPGEYLLYFTDTNQKKIASQKITVKYRDRYSFSSNDISNVYYDNCKMVFCQRVIAGKTYKERNDLYLKNGKGMLYCYLNNYKSLNTGTLIVNFWRKDRRSFEYNEIVKTKKYKVDPLWNDTFFKCFFDRPGDYKIAVYNENEALIKYNFVKVY